MLVTLNIVYKKLKDTFDKNLIGIEPAAGLVSDTIIMTVDIFSSNIGFIILKIVS